jgi:hypothetical protein
MNCLTSSCLWITLFLIVSPIGTFAIDSHSTAAGRTGDSLSVTGEVKEIRLRKNLAAGEMVIDALVTLHFKNHSSSPLLVFVAEGWPLQGAETLSVSKEDVLSHKYVFVSGSWPSSDRAAWEETRHKLEQKSPPPDLVRSIGPGEEWREDRAVVMGIQIDGSIDRNNKPWDVIRKTEHLWLQLQFMMWPSNLEQDASNPAFGKRLRRMWKHRGLLVIDKVASEPIPLTLPN